MFPLTQLECQVVVEYTEDATPFWLWCNRGVGDDSMEKKTQTLLSILERSPSQGGVVYRYLVDTDEDCVDEEIECLGPLSTTNSWDVATTRSNIVLTIEVDPQVKMVDISRYSTHPHEREVLVDRCVLYQVKRERISVTSRMGSKRDCHHFLYRASPQ